MSKTAPMAVGLALALAGRAGAAEATAADIVRRAHATAGGQAWLRATTSVLTGHATLFRNGLREHEVKADRYVMHRVYPRELTGAHQGTGKFRLEARAGDRLLFLLAFDGQRSYDQDGPLAPERARTDEANAFGFSAIRFALEKGFSLERLADDEVEGRPCHFVKVIDPSGSSTVFGVDASDFAIRYAGWRAPRGWHHRLYSDFSLVSGTSFRQPGRVRLYYDGVKEADIVWTKAEIGGPLPDDLFVVPARSASAAPVAIPVSVEATAIVNYQLLRPGLATAGTPSAGALATLKAQGFRTVIDLRLPEEGTAAEKAVVEAQGLRYVSVPISPATLSPGDAAAVARVLDDPEAGPVLLHCASANRVGAVWTVIEARRGRPFEEAEAEGRRIGLKPGPMADAVRRVLGELAAPRRP
jgi:uncharacterized protein (TIGR01244 family)